MLSGLLGLDFIICLKDELVFPSALRVQGSQITCHPAGKAEGQFSP